MMINKEIVRKIIIPGCVFILICIVIFFAVLNYQNKKYQLAVNESISGIIDEVLKKYPKTSEEEIIKIINGSSIKEHSEILKKYGYTTDIAYLKNLEDNMNNSIKIDILLITLFGILGIAIILIYSQKQNKKIKDIHTYLQQLNKRNYDLKIEENSEDELSKLRNELYKTTVLLKESAKNSEQEKINLSNSLADISHQLKTPLTSIRILLDNIYENPNMDEKTKSDFIGEISKQIDWISSLVISLLKLAKFDAGSIIMNDKNINVKELINDVITNLDVMMELKNINVVQEIEENITFIGDYKWQVEALTNIIKNAIEHSKENSKIYIKVENTTVFLKITIQDEGEGINKQDLKHIFERFYKAKNSSEESIGIGLALAKTIIEKENGYVRADSVKGKGTIFEIKYLK